MKGNAFLPVVLALLLALVSVVPAHAAANGNPSYTPGGISISGKLVSEQSDGASPYAMLYLGGPTDFLDIPLPDGGTRDYLDCRAIQVLDAPDQYIDMEITVTGKLSGQTEGQDARTPYLLTCNDASAMNETPKSISVSPKSATITYHPDMAGNVRLTAIIGPEGALQYVRWSSSDHSVATVLEDGLVVATGGGEAIITAESSNGRQATCKITVTVPITAITLTQTEVRLSKRGEKKTLIATVMPSGALNEGIKWVSDNPDIATVDKNGTIRAIANGRCTVSAVTVDESVAADCIVIVGEEGASGEPEDESGENEETPDEDETESGAGDEAPGEEEIQSGTNEVPPTTDETASNGKDLPETEGGLSKIVITCGQDSYPILQPRTTRQLGIRVEPLDAERPDVTWHSSNPDIASVDKFGVLTANKVGVAVIEARSSLTGEDGTPFSAATVCLVTSSVESNVEPFTDNDLAVSYHGQRLVLPVSLAEFKELFTGGEQSKQEGKDAYWMNDVRRGIVYCAWFEDEEDFFGLANYADDQSIATVRGVKNGRSMEYAMLKYGAPTTVKGVVTYSVSGSGKVTGAKYAAYIYYEQLDPYYIQFALDVSSQSIQQIYVGKPWS